jgi:hypothetical protein
MKAVIVAVLMAFGAFTFAVPAAQAGNAHECYAWWGVRYQVGRHYGCWTVRYGKQGWNNSCNCKFRQKVFLRDGKRVVGTVRECTN